MPRKTAEVRNRDSGPGGLEPLSEQRVHRLGLVERERLFWVGLVHTQVHTPVKRAWDRAPNFDPVERSVCATQAGVEALRLEMGERGPVKWIPLTDPFTNSAAAGLRTTSADEVRAILARLRGPATLEWSALGLWTTSSRQSSERGEGREGFSRRHNMAHLVVFALDGSSW